MEKHQLHSNDKIGGLKTVLFFVVMLFAGIVSAQCVNPAWNGAKHWSTYVVGEIYSEDGKDWVVHTPAWCQSFSPSSANGNLGFSLAANPCDAGASEPTLTLTGSSNVTCTTADFTGNISDDGGSDATTRGFIYGTNVTDVNNSTIGSLVGASTIASEAGSFGTGDWTLGVTGLSNSVTYYVRAFATNATGTTYSAGTASFFTCAVIPTLTTSAISALSCETGNSGGNISSDGGDPVTARGVCWSTSSPATIADSKTTNGSGTGAFASAISGMSEGTTYYVRAYATNGIGTGYGNEISFTTASGCTPVYYSCAASNSWSLNTDCSTNDGLPGATDYAVLRHDWFNMAAAGSYSLANLAWGQTGNTWFNAKPLKLTVQSGGRAVFTSSSYTALPANFSLVVDPGGIFASYTSLEVINSFENNGSVHLFGAVTNGNDIVGLGDLCYDGNFENSTLAGSLNGAFLSANEAALAAGFFTTPGGALGGNCGDLGGLLPIELISFELERINSNVEITWVTGSEINNDYFQVLGSVDGIHWSVISTVNGAGNSTSVSNYTSIDNTITNEDVKYYKLKQVDFDGSSRYSKTKVISFSENGGILTLYDDGTFVNVLFDVNKGGEAVVSLLDINGKEIAKSSVLVQAEEQNFIKLPKPQVVSGVYCVKIQTAGLIFAKKILLR